MMHLDDLIEVLDKARERHGNMKCAVAMCDGEVKLDADWLPEIEFHQEGDGFVQLVFYMFDETGGRPAK